MQGYRQHPGFIFSRLCIWIFILIISADHGFAQNQKKTDSLLAIYESGDYTPDQMIGLLGDIAGHSPDPDLSLKYAEKMLAKAVEFDSTKAIYRAYLQQGNAYEAKGDLSTALESYFKAVDVINSLGDKRELGTLYIAMAGVYAGMGNKANIVQYYSKAIDLLKNVDRTLYAISLENFGDVYLELSKPDSALLLFTQSGAVFKDLGIPEYLAYNKGNTGLAYAQKGQSEKAEEFITEAIAMLEKIGNYRPITTYLTFMSDIYADKNDWDAAFDYSLRALRLAKHFGLKAEISEAYLKLSELYERTGYPSAALKYYRNYIAFRDSVRNISAMQEMANNELARKQIEIDLGNQRRKTQRIVVLATGIALFLIILLAIGLFRRNRYIRKTNEIIAREKERSDKLLLNILPEKTANELKKNGTVKAEKLESVSVLFTDFLSFTTHSEQTDPELLVNTVGIYFTAFDDIIERHGLEKIKTI
jgi:tetratricopeptide (TPR) repeat protein